MNDQIETNQRLFKLIQSLKDRADGLSRADMDEIALLVDRIKVTLPPRFWTVVEDFDRNFSGSRAGQIQFIDRLLRIIEVEQSLPEKETTLENDPLIPEFSLSKKDRDRVLKLCSDMRKIVLASPDFDEPHRVLMLNRIAAVEKQAIDKRGKLDVVRGAASDIGETLGKFGKDIKPLTDRFKEVVKITRDATPDYDQIPAPEELKQLPAPVDEE